MMKKLEVEQICTIFAILFFVFGLFINGTAAFFCMLCTWCICGYRVAFRAVRGLVNRQLLDENFLMTVASVGAFFLGDYLEGAAVMLFSELGSSLKIML